MLLLRYDAGDGQWIEASFTDGDLTGVPAPQTELKSVELKWGDDFVPVAVDGIRVVDARLVIEFKVPGLPGFTGSSRFARPLTAALEHDGSGDWTLRKVSADWFDDIDDPQFVLNDWVRKKKPVTGEAALDIEDDFTLSAFGLSVGANEPEFDKANVGVFQCKSERSLFVAFVPIGNVDDDGAQLAIPRLKNLIRLKHDLEGEEPDPKSFRVAPAVFLYPLADRRVSSGTERWEVLVEWRPEWAAGQNDEVPDDDGSRIDFLSANDVFQHIWNPSVDLERGGHRIGRGGSGWSALPEFTIATGTSKPPGDGELGKKTRVVLQIEAWPERSGFVVRRVVPFRTDDRAGGLPAAARFQWKAFEAVPPNGWPDSEAPSPPAEAPPALTLSAVGPHGSADLKDLRWDEPEDGAWLTPAEINALAGLRAPRRESLRLDEVAEFRFGLKAPTPGSWINVGSLEFRPREEGSVPEDNALVCSLRGRWDDSYCDLHPEFELKGYPCWLRHAPTPDPVPDSLRSRFDNESLAEDELLRESSGSIVWDAVGDGIPATLEIRVANEIDRDPVVEWTFRRDPGSGAFGQERGGIYMSTRPASFARVGPPNLDPETGTILAIWRSDDPQGPQWRVADAQVQIDFPPQAVADEMERGLRFYEKPNEPYINPAKPLKSRLSPPTRMLVRPSVEPRRYHPHPNNVHRILDGAVVDGFTTEILYPVRTRFQPDERGRPEIRVAELGSLLGRPAPNLPRTGISVGLAHGEGDVKRFKQLLRDVIADDLGNWAARALGEVALDPFLKAYEEVRGTHVSTSAGFVARLAEYRLYDPYAADGGLDLTDGLEFQIRSTEQGAPPLANPLARRGLTSGVWTELSTNITDQLASEIEPFVQPDEAQGLRWGTSDQDGAIVAGALHTIEFSSELGAVLREPVSELGRIDELSFSMLGASGKASMSFDEGRTTFVVESAHGLVVRLTKIRIGRIGVLWNRARHVIVYDRTVVPSLQFEDQQALRPMLGWPMLRKSEEYVEPIERIRVFEAEADAEENSTACVRSVEFTRPRIYVDGAWGRDVKKGSKVHGYEIPLWNRDDRSGFYPKPEVAAWGEASEDGASRLWFEDPDELVFYSNTEKGTGNNPDAWEPKHGVDLSFGPSRLEPLMTPKAVTGETSDERAFGAIARADSVPSPTTTLARRPRFDLRVRPDGPVDLQHGRGDTEMLAEIRLVSLARTADSGPFDGSALGSPQDADDSRYKRLFEKPIESLRETQAYGARVDQVRARLDQFVRSLPKEILSFDTLTEGCKALKNRLTAQIESVFAEARADLDALADGEWLPKLPEVEVAAALEAEIERRGIYGYDPLKRVVTKLERFVEGASRLSEDEVRGRFGELRAQLQVFLELVRTLLERAADAYERGVSAPYREASRQLATTLRQPLVELGNALGKDIPPVVAAPPKADLEEALLDYLDEAAGHVKAAKNAVTELGPLAAHVPLPMRKRLMEALDQLAAAVSEARSVVVYAIDEVAEVRRAAVELVTQVREKAIAIVEQTRTGVDGLIALMEGLAPPSIEDLRAPLKALRDVAESTGDELRTAMEKLKEAAEKLDRDLPWQHVGQLLAQNPQTALTHIRKALKEVKEEAARVRGVAEGKPDDEARTLALGLAAYTRGRFDIARAGPFAVGVQLLEKAEKEILDAKEDTFAKVLEGLDTQREQLDVEYQLARDHTLSVVRKGADALDTQIKALRSEILKLFKKLRASAKELADEHAHPFLRGLETKAIGVVNSLGDDACGSLDTFREKLEKEVEEAKEEIRKKVTGAIDGMLDDSTREQMEKWGRDWSKELGDLGAKAGTGIKLVKAIGDLPELGRMTANAITAEYVFDDLAKGIRTSPFAAKLGEIDAGLKELGLSVPTRELLDQVLPEDIPIDFNALVRNLGGIDFDGLFKRFKLPRVKSEHVRVTHGLDKATRTAWAKARVDISHPGEERLFGDSSFGVAIAEMALKARSDVRIGRDGVQKSVTDGSLQGNWSLDMGGARLVRFEEVAVRFDGDGFDFDLDPSKVKFHPSLQFLSAFSLEGKLPPEIQVEKDGRGIPVGARAQFSTPIGPFKAPAVEIGRTVIEGGLGLSMRNGTFLVGANFSLGTRKAPLFVQISWLGGGLWLTSECEYNASANAISYSGEVALALGSARSLTIAAVARGHYSVLLYAAARFSNTGGSLRAGLSIRGGAQIMGIAHASLSLLLEATHTDGKTTGRGVLDLEIEICWCYTLRVHRTVTRDL